ncbi:MAG: hypothetical protein AB2707_01510 [Candidatus Thiodiazotropha sp.]
MKQNARRIGVLLICMLLMNAAAAAQKRTVNPATGARSWETSVAGVTLLLTQILPDQARAFYLNRGLPAEATEAYATACVYMIVLRNDSAPGVVHFRQADWSVVSGGASRPPLSLETWFERFEAYGLSKSAAIAFRWAQFPAEQDYQPGGDWNQGMLTTGLPAGAEFDLVARWDVAGRNYEGVLKNVRCAN